MTPPRHSFMEIYTGDGFDNVTSKLSVHPVEEDKPEDEDPTEPAGLGHLASEFISGTTAHGVPRLLSEPSLIRRLAWLVIFVVAFAMCVLMTYLAVVEYLRWPVEINIEYKVRTEAEFPAVTVCNLNPLKKSKLKDTQYEVLKTIDEIYAQALKNSRVSLKEDQGQISQSGPSDAGSSSDPIDDRGRSWASYLIDTDGPSDSSDTGGPSDTSDSSDTGGQSDTSDPSGTSGSGDTSDSSGTSGSGDTSDSSGTSGSGLHISQTSESGEASAKEPQNTQVKPVLSAQTNTGGIKNGDILANAASDTDFESFMQYSQTADYSDMTDLLKPTKESFDAFGHQAKDFILQCSFDKSNCSYLDFTKVYNSRYGNCFVFNLNATTTTLYGSKYGLRLTLNVEPDDYVGLFSHEVGVRIAVHAANVTAFPEDEGVNAPSEYATSMGVTKSTFKRLPKPYASMCADGSNHTLLDEGEYTVWSCSLACLQSNLKKTCGCSDRVGLPSSETTCSFTNSVQEVCRQRVYALYNKGQLGCYCPLPCNQVQYNNKVSMAMWPSESYIPILWDKIGDDLQALGYTDVEDAKHALSRVHVYMEDLTVHCTEEHAAFTLEDLFANMGGYLGLFIGISACTIMEFFEFVMDAMGYLSITVCGGCVKDTTKKIGVTLSRTRDNKVSPSCDYAPLQDQ